MKYGNTRMQTLQFKLTLLKQDLKATSVRLRWLKKNHARHVINSKFNSNKKSVYRDFKGSNITANETPTKNEVEEFWKSIWEKETKFNKNAKWLKKLEKTYCKDVTPKTYKADRQTVDQVINNMSLNKSPGKELIIAFWFKKLHFYRYRLTELYQNTYDGEGTLPTWLTEAKAILIAKNEHTNNTKNYKPIACLNLTYIIYTNCLNIFLTDHCS